MFSAENLKVPTEIIDLSSGIIVNYSCYFLNQFISREKDNTNLTGMHLYYFSLYFFSFIIVSRNGKRREFNTLFHTKHCVR